MSTMKREFRKLTESQKRQLLTINAVRDEGGIEYFPCSVLLRNGERIDCVYLADINQFKRATVYNIERDDDDIYLQISDVTEISESPHRIPPAISRKIYLGEETAMGGIIFTLEFADKTEQLYECGNFVDFLPLPPGKTMSDIVDVRLHTVPIRTQSMRGLSYKWCYFSG